MPTTLTPQQFVAKWRDNTLKERAASQEHFIDLCRLVGHPTPSEDDPTGERFTFEAGADKLGGGQGWADVWKRSYFPSAALTLASVRNWERTTPVAKTSCSWWSRY